MSDWVEMELGDVLTLQRGFDLPKRARNPGPYPVVSSSGVTGSHDEFKVNPPGVVIGRYGSLGSVHWVTEPFWPLNTALWVKDFKANDPRFVSFLLKTVAMDGSAAAAVPGVNRNHLHKLTVRLPGLATQRQVAAVLSAIDDLIEINEQRIDVLEGIAHTHFRHAFPAIFERSLSEGTVASDLIAVNPKVAKRDGPYPCVTMADVSTAHSHVLPSSATARYSGSKFQRGDVLMARITPSLENGKTALALFPGPEEVGVGSTEFIVLRGKGVGPAFVYCAARDPYFRGHAIRSMSGASGRQRVAPECFDTLAMTEPSGDLNVEFESIAMPILELVLQLRKKNDALASARDRLLPRLATGQLDISDFEFGVLTPTESE